MGSHFERSSLVNLNSEQKLAYIYVYIYLQGISSMYISIIHGCEISVVVPCYTSMIGISNGKTCQHDAPTNASWGP